MELGKKTLKRLLERLLQDSCTQPEKAATTFAEGCIRPATDPRDGQHLLGGPERPVLRRVREVGVVQAWGGEGGVLPPGVIFVVARPADLPLLPKVGARLGGGVQRDALQVGKGGVGRERSQRPQNLAVHVTAQTLCAGQEAHVIYILYAYHIHNIYI